MTTHNQPATGIVSDALLGGNSLVRENLLTVPGYAPYCGAEVCRFGTPRTSFDVDIGQFHCRCGWRSNFASDFMEAYRKFRIDSQVCTKCGVTVGNRMTKYCGDGSDKDNAHVWKSPEYKDDNDAKRREYSLLPDDVGVNVFKADRVEDLARLLATIHERFGNTAIRYSIQWGASALWAEDAQKEEIRTLKELLAGVVRRCEPHGYVGRDGQFLKVLKAATESA